MSQVYDVMVVGSNLCGLLCAWLCQQHGLSTVLLGEAPTDIESAGFDSLAPEGVHSLHHVLKPEQIKHLSQGTFSGVWRNGDFNPFEPPLGSGLQINTHQLKQVLWHLLSQSAVDCPLVPLQQIQACQDVIDAETVTQLNFQAYWCLDASGLESPASTQTVEWLTQALWIQRRVYHDSRQCNRAEFISDHTGWQWLAFDQVGECTKTEFSLDFNPLDTQQPVFNCQWYRRKNILEARVLLVGNSAFRFDPAAGTGLAQTLKSALHAATSIYQIHKQNAPEERVLKAYEHYMNNYFYSVYEPLGAFYHQLGVWVF